MNIAPFALVFACVLPCAVASQARTQDPHGTVALVAAEEVSPAAAAHDPELASTSPTTSADTDDGAASPAPEPASLLLVGAGLILLAVTSRRWRRTLVTGV